MCIRDSYCTKSSHFSFVLEEAMKNDIHLETSSAYDIHIILSLIHILRRNNGRRREAAAELFMSERTLYRKIKELGIDENS